MDSAAKLEPLVAARRAAALRPREFARLARAEVEAIVANTGNAAQEIERLEGLLEKLRRQEQTLRLPHTWTASAWRRSK